MGYVGNQTSNSYSSMDKQVITGNGGASYTLTHAVANAQEIEVFVNNVRQEAGVAYTVNGTALSMTGNVASTDDFYVIYQGKALQTGVPPDDSVSTAKIQDGAVTSSKIASGAVSSESYAIIGDVKSSGTNGGSSVVGWQTRDLNTELFDPDGIVSIASNKFTLGAGSYVVSWMCQSYRSNQQKSKLVNDTDSTDVQVGLAQYASSTATNTQSSTGSAGFTISGSKAFKIEHYISNAQSANGLGVNIGSTGDEIYTLVNITKLA